MKQSLNVDEFFSLTGENREAIVDWMKRNDVPMETFAIEIVSEKPPHAIAHYFRRNAPGAFQIDASGQVKTNQIHVYDLPPIPK